MINETLSSSSDIENTCPPDVMSPPPSTQSQRKILSVTPQLSSYSKQESKATSSRSKDSRLPSARTGSVFERLYRTQTKSTEIRRDCLSPTLGTNQQRSSNTQVSQRKTTPSRANSPMLSVDESTKVLERLNISSPPLRRTNMAKNRLLDSSEKQMKMTTPSPSRKIPSTRTPFIASLKSPSVKYVYSPRIKPLTSLYFDSKYHPGMGRERIDPISLGSSFFQAFCEYENGGLTPAQIAREIIIAFFRKDFPAGRHWELHEPSVEDQPGQDDSYGVKMCATYDRQDAFRIASAQGVVRCNREAGEVSVLNYIYDVTSDL